MTGAEIAALIIRLGPVAFDWIADLAAIWTKQMTPDEVAAFVKEHRKSYDAYIDAEKAKRVP